MSKTKIEWSEYSWNPVTGCTKISAGCRNCYAERMSKRLAGRHGYPPAPDNFKVTLRPDRLEQPLKWKKPRRVFVCSMSDLFHHRVPQSFIEDVFRTIARCPQHIFQILTKRPARMKKYAEYIPYHLKASGLNSELGNVWWGVTAENQQAADARIPLLLQTPAAVRFVSAEPLLSEINLHLHGTVPGSWHGTGWQLAVHSFLDWVITGGETGPGARPMHPDWTRGLRDQCQAAGVPFFHKSNGEWLIVHPARKSCEFSSPKNKCAKIDTDRFYRAGKKHAGHMLDGQVWREMPEATP